MKTLKEDFFDNLGIGEESLIKEWLNQYKIKNYTINDDFTIDVKGDVYLIEYKEKQLPDYIQFGKVAGNFNIMLSRSLETLKGAPQEVGRHFYCSFCEKLKSLDGCPRQIGGDFECWGCTKLKTLKGAPQKVGYSFKCSHCLKLTSLKGCPNEIGGRFDCNDCPKLESLEGAQKEVDGDFECKSCGNKFTKNDVKKISNVKGKIKV